MTFARIEDVVPDAASGIDQFFAAQRNIDIIDGRAVHVHHAEHRAAVEVEPIKRAGAAGEFGTGEVALPGEDRGDRATHRSAGIAVVGQAQTHQHRAEVRIAQAQRAEGVRVRADQIAGVAAVIDENILGDEENAGRGAESIDIESAIGFDELHQVQARQVARRVVDEHVLAARIRRTDLAAVLAGVPPVNRGVILQARVAAYVRAFGDRVHQLAGLVGVHRFVGRDGAGGPVAIGLHARQELVGHADRQVRVLVHHRRVRLAVERSVVALFDQGPRLAFFARLALDEVFDIRVRDAQRLHLRSPTRLATALDDTGDLVEHPHETQRARRRAAPSQLLTARAQRREVRARARAILKEHRLVTRQPHDVFHRVLNGLDETGRALRVLIVVCRAFGLVGFGVPVEVAIGTSHTILLGKPNVEPHRRIERAHLIHSQVGQVLIKVLGVFVGGEQAVGLAPVGDRPRDAVYELTYRVLALGCAVLAVEVFAHDNVRRQLTPAFRDLNIVLIENGVALRVADVCRARRPSNIIKRVRARCRE